MNTSTPAPGPYDHLQKKVDDTGLGVPCDFCSKNRRDCNRKWAPGGPPACVQCQKRAIPCSWDTFGSRGTSTRKKKNNNQVEQEQKREHKEDTDAKNSELLLPLGSSKQILKKDCDTEGSWKYMGDLALEHAPTMRRVMILVYHKLNFDEKLFPCKPLQWRYLTREERKRVHEMTEEAKDNDLLEEMLRWFSAKYMDKDEEIVEATKTLQKHVSNGVRHPKMYQVEYLEARKKWKEFLGVKEDNAEMGAAGLSTTASRPSEFITSVPKQKPAREDAIRMTASERNAFKNKTEPAFRPTYSYESKNWREELTFNRASAQAHFGQESWDMTQSSDGKQQVIEMPYCYTTADEDVKTEADPDEIAEEVNIFAVEDLPARKTRGGKEYSAYVREDSPMNNMTSPKKSPTAPKKSSMKSMTESPPRDGDKKGDGLTSQIRSLGKNKNYYEKKVPFYSDEDDIDD